MQGRVSEDSTPVRKANFPWMVPATGYPRYGVLWVKDTIRNQNQENMKGLLVISDETPPANVQKYLDGGW